MTAQMYYCRQAVLEEFVEAAKSQDFEIVSTQSFTKDTKTDFSVQVQSCKDAGADLVFLPIYSTDSFFNSYRS